MTVLLSAAVKKIPEAGATQKAKRQPILRRYTDRPDGLLEELESHLGVSRLYDPSRRSDGKTYEMIYPDGEKVEYFADEIGEYKTMRSRTK